VGGGGCGTARLCGGESSGDQWCSDGGICGFLALGGRLLFFSVGLEFLLAPLESGRPRDLDPPHWLAL
jgi:hypothetical protein